MVTYEIKLKITATSNVYSYYRRFSRPIPQDKLVRVIKIWAEGNWPEARLENISVYRGNVGSSYDWNQEFYSEIYQFTYGGKFGKSWDYPR